jgi:SAM-dependent methyltransferase
MMELRSHEDPALFESADEYDEMLHRGLALAGEDKHYFIRGRVAELLRWVSPPSIRRVLDLGCGVGHGTRALAESYPEASVVGVDASGPAIRVAQAQFGSPKLRFLTVDAFRPEADFDLCHMNGVLHHVKPEDRPGVLTTVKAALAPGGCFALFENNPWNPGTRLVMKRIPFDREAQTLSPRAARDLLIVNGFQIARTRFLFYFPRALSLLRVLEPRLARLPLGGQYLVLARQRPLPSTSRTRSSRASLTQTPARSNRAAR